jgi:hypothetical protein
MQLAASTTNAESCVTNLICEAQICSLAGANATSTLWEKVRISSCPALSQSSSTLTVLIGTDKLYVSNPVPSRTLNH